ncbi:MAG: glycosyltransferase [Candidatus Shapirobacteria bacterium]
MNKSLAKAKVAIYYDWLNQWGGAEKVLLNILKIFPKAEIFTLFYDSKKTTWLPKNIKINTSFLQKLPKTNLLTPIYDIAAESFDFKNFDIIISTTSNIGHSLLTNPQSLFVCYYHNLNRHIYLKPPKLLIPLLNIYKTIDKILAKRPDAALCNSTTTQNRLQKYLNIDSTIINPGIDTKYFTPINKPTNDYFLVVGRLVPHKSVDYVVKTFLNLNQKLIIVGSGREQNKLKNMAKNSNNIIFTGQVDNRKLLSLYQNCTALICPQFEDFGIISLEAQSCGRPIIYFNNGGIAETNINNTTGIGFDHQNQQSLNNAINKFIKTKFDHKFISHHVKQYDESVFMLKFKEEIDKLWHNKYL